MDDEEVSCPLCGYEEAIHEAHGKPGGTGDRFTCSECSTTFTVDEEGQIAFD